jgi:large subunit ribosomal protein L14
MLFKQSILYSADNSGAKIFKCIDVVGKNNALGTTGNTVLVSVKKFVHKKKLKKTILYFGLLITTKQSTHRIDGSCIKFCSNRALVFSNQFKFLGTRVYGGVSKDIKIKLSSGFLDKKKYQKAISYTSFII